jgi:hypothetical protein
VTSAAWRKSINGCPERGDTHTAIRPSRDNGSIVVDEQQANRTLMGNERARDLARRSADDASVPTAGDDLSVVAKSHASDAAGVTHAAGTLIWRLTEARAIDTSVGTGAQHIGITGDHNLHDFAAVGCNHRSAAAVKTRALHLTVPCARHDATILCQHQGANWPGMFGQPARRADVERGCSVRAPTRPGRSSSLPFTRNT